MTKANDPASPCMHPTGTFTGMTIREQMALTLTAAIISANQTPKLVECIELGVRCADALIVELNNPTK